MRVLLVGREAPVGAWFGAGWDGLFHSVALGPLVDDEAELLLTARGHPPDEARRLNRIARGHPLALTLASAAARERPDLVLEEAATTRVVTELTRIYLEDVPDPLTRRALEAASVIRRVTQPLLGAMLPESASQDAFDRLLTLPFIDVGSDGVLLHDAVREPISSFLRSTDPSRHRDYRRAAWRRLRSEVRDAAAAELWRYTADMLYLIANPVVREAFFPSGAQPLVVEPARSEDGPAMFAIAARHDGPEAVAQLEGWWAARAEHVLGRPRPRRRGAGVLRPARQPDDPAAGSDGRPRGRGLAAPSARPSAAAGTARAGAAALARRRLRRGTRAGAGRLLARRQAHLHGHAAGAAAHVRHRQRRGDLPPGGREARIPAAARPARPARARGRRVRPRPSASTTADYASVVLDFGAGSVDGWLARLVAAELGLDDDAPLDESARELTVGGRRVALTPLEFGVLRHLDAAAGRTVSRPELLSEVWGYEFAGGSNVVDAAVRSLRHKLGDAAVVVETVRGAGYRVPEEWRTLVA